MELNNGIETYYPRTKAHWRKWLEKNSQSKTEVCLILYHKKSPVPGISYDEALEEALCFGWIDSMRNKRDHESYYQRFSPRKTRSNWSDRNKKIVGRLIREKRMKSGGLQMVEEAKVKGTWD
ncbi:YdeI/OmpD-associated family protein [Membranihabitans maritimus]|uniref:YdeI/OmpD-associated family protein n=1 Tax=Membranihabitans maritimus TaxID=2904244 RepID=UPI001F44AF6B|nr:hypothetical protein [Membranihabitans maritimus]